MPARTSPLVPPPKDLDPFVVGFVQRQDDEHHVGAIELPWPNPTLQVMLGAGYAVAGEMAPRTGLWGPQLRPAESRTDGPVDAFITVLTARGAAALARAELADLISRRLDATGLAEGVAALEARLFETSDHAGRIRLTIDWLRGLNLESRSRPSSAVGLADDVLSHRIRGSVASLASERGVSPRALHKTFDLHVGCGPKQLLRVTRLQRVLRALHPQPWSRSASHDDPWLEFTDQSHLDRDFLNLTGVTRSVYVARKREKRDGLVHTLI